MVSVELYPIQHYYNDVIVRVIERATNKQPVKYLKRIEQGVLNEDAVRYSIKNGTAIIAPLNWLNYMDKIGKVREF